MENLLSTVPVQSRASSTGIKSRFSLQFEQGVSVDTERAKAKEQGIKKFSLGMEEGSVIHGML